MNTQQPCYIVSVWKSGDSVSENRNKQLMIEKFLWKRGYEFLTVDGFWEGQHEESLVLFNEEIAQTIATEHNQDSYMYIDGNNYASLHTKDGKLKENLGRLKSSLTKPKTLCYTYQKQTGVYYYI